MNMKKLGKYALGIAGGGCLVGSLGLYVKDLAYKAYNTTYNNCVNNLHLPPDIASLAASLSIACIGLTVFALLPLAYEGLRER